MNSAIDGAPPRDEYAEQAVLGSMLQSQPAASELLDSMTVTDFYWPRHGIVFAAAAALRDDDQPVDALTVANRLAETSELKQVGGAPYLHTLIAAPPTAANFGYYAEIVRGHAQRRRLLEHAAFVTQQATAVDVDVDVARSRIADDFESSEACQATTQVSVMGEWWDDFLERELSDETVHQISTGLPDLDKKFNGGFKPGQLVIVAGRPGMGKTAVMAQMARETARHEGVLFLTLEQTKRDITKRLISAEGAIPFSALQQNPWTDSLTSRVMDATPSLPMKTLAIDDTADTIDDISRLAHQHHAQRGIKVLVVDYIQLVRASGKHPSREQEVADVSRRLKLLARKLGIVVILGSQFNRNSEGRPDKRPQLADLRESGSLEQDCDIAILLHREDYYDPESPREGELDMHVAKNRDGETGTVTVAAQLHLMRIRSIAR